MLSGDSHSMPPTLVPIKLGPTRINTIAMPKLSSTARAKLHKVQPRRQGITTLPSPQPARTGLPLPPHSGGEYGGNGGGQGPPQYSAPLGEGGPLHSSRGEMHGDSPPNLPIMGLPPPPTLTDPSQLPGEQVRGTALVTIVAVDNAQFPKYATVAVNNKFPFEGSYTLPAGCGPFYKGPPKVKTTSNTAVDGAPKKVDITPNNMIGIKVGLQLICDDGSHGTQETVTVLSVGGTDFTAEFHYNHTVNFSIRVKGASGKGQQGFYWYDDPVSLKGGSIALADLDRKAILHFTGNESDTPPTPYYKAIADHKHDGNLNQDGFDNADPNDLGGGTVTGQLPYSNQSSQVFTMIDPNGNLLAVEFPSAVIQPDGSLAQVNNVTSTQTYPLVAGQLIELSVQLAREP